MFSKYWLLIRIGNGDLWMAVMLKRINIVREQRVKHRRLSEKPRGQYHQDPFSSRWLWLAS
ncbi:hypothetical protein SAMN05428978_102741 [Nitrosomonas sp. Nm34]|nr:hypothetical protein SAMN05428978_102741 [Nitrosomonas sp. Nm34]